MKIFKITTSTLRRIYSIFKTIYKKFLIHFLGSHFLKKPDTINLNITYKCNSKCIMCNIWKRDKQIELTPYQLGKILRDRLFKNITHVGVTGGEATLREDLAFIFETITENLPRLKSVSIITNALNCRRCIEQIEKIERLCDRESVAFGVMVSLDGTEPYHDKNRGIHGSYKAAINLINELKKHERINLSIACTITKNNVWDLDRFFDFLKENEIYGRFRVAEFINRLNNNSNRNVIKNFDDDEIFHLQLFFHKLQFRYEKNNAVKRTYQNIVSMLGGGNRQTACPYQYKAVVLGPCGEFAYCAPKSNIIGNVIQESAYKLWKRNRTEKQRILREDCKNCIHDYHSHHTIKVELSKKIKVWSKKSTEKYYKTIVRLFQMGVISKPKKSPGHYTVFIVGWYGTETVGDKAILAGIVNHYKSKHPRNTIIIGSLHPFITRRTIKELNIEATVVDSTSIDLIRYSAVADETVMGGGPLMDLHALYIPYIAFYSSNKFNKKRCIFGCGIGPLVKYQQTVENILQLATEIKVRDLTSKKIAGNWTKRSDIFFIGDPAQEYITEIKDRINSDDKRQIACFLREWTIQYAPNLTKNEFYNQRVMLENEIANTINSMREKLNIEKVKLYHMHNFHIGGDDRAFSRRFIKTYFNGCNFITCDDKLSTVDSIVSAMKSSKLNLCMRFHSVLFAHTLGVNFLALDYTFGGKIYKYLEDNNALDRLVEFSSIKLLNSNIQLIK